MNGIENTWELVPVPYDTELQEISLVLEGQNQSDRLTDNIICCEFQLQGVQLGDESPKIDRLFVRKALELRSHQTVEEISQSLGLTDSHRVRDQLTDLFNKKVVDYLYSGQPFALRQWFVQKKEIFVFDVFSEPSEESRKYADFIWEQLIQSVSALTGTLLVEHGRLSYLDANKAIFQIRSKALAKIARAKQELIREALITIIGKPIDVEIQSASFVSNQGMIGITSHHKDIWRDLLDSLYALSSLTGALFEEHSRLESISNGKLIIQFKSKALAKIALSKIDDVRTALKSISDMKLLIDIQVTPDIEPEQKNIWSVQAQEKPINDDRTLELGLTYDDIKLEKIGITGDHQDIWKQLIDSMTSLTGSFFEEHGRLESIDHEKLIIQFRSKALSTIAISKIDDVRNALKSITDKKLLIDIQIIPNNKLEQKSIKIDRAEQNSISDDRSGENPIWIDLLKNVTSLTAALLSEHGKLVSVARDRVTIQMKNKALAKIAESKSSDIQDAYFKISGKKVFIDIHSLSK